VIDDEVGSLLSEAIINEKIKKGEIAAIDFADNKLKMKVEHEK
jgi:hypothetical protein